MKAAFILPIVKKADINTMDAKSYRRISNLPKLFKLFENSFRL